MFVLSSFVLQAQYVGPSQAILILTNEATSIEDGSTDIKELISNANVATSGSTITALPSGSTSDISLANLTDLYPAIMNQTVKEIELAGNTQIGVQNAEATFASMTSESSREDLIDEAFIYIKSLISI